jgi:hypothetical protein
MMGNVDFIRGANFCSRSGLGDPIRANLAPRGRNTRFLLRPTERRAVPPGDDEPVDFVIAR